MMHELPDTYAAPQPVLRSARLTLRPFLPADAAVVEPLINDAEVAAGTLTIPHPYPEGAAAEWIAGHRDAWHTARTVTWAITDSETRTLLGAISIKLTLAHHRGEVGYWVAKARWGKGIATEAVRAVLRCAFETLALHRVDAHHFVENPASGTVMRKAGMQFEGRRRGAIFRAGVPRDLDEYSILSTDPRP